MSLSPPASPASVSTAFSETVGVQRAEALVDEQRLDDDAARVLLDCG